MRILSKYATLNCFFLILLWISSPSYAQQYISSTHHFSVEKGLSQRLVLDVIEDQQGFIWINTLNGVDRFDGEQFKNYPLQQYGFREDVYLNIFIDRNGLLWFTHNTNDYRIRRKDIQQTVDVFNPLKEELVKDLKLPVKEDDILEIQNDKEKNIWISTKTGNLFKYDGDQFLIILKKQQFDDFVITSSNTVAVIDTSTSLIQFYDYANNLLEDYTFPNVYSKAFSGKNGNMILQTYDKNSFHFVRYHPTQSPSKVAFSDKENNPIQFEYTNPFRNMFLSWRGEEVLLNDSIGTYLFDKDFKLLHHFDHKDLSVYQGMALEFYIDSKNRAWLPSNNGVFIYVAKKSLFTNYLVSEKLNDTRAITQDGEGNLFINQKFSKRIDGKTNQVEVVGKNGGKRGIFISPGGVLLTGDYLGNVTGIDLKKNIEFRYLKETDIGMSNIFYQSKKTGRLYLGSERKGVFLVDEENKKLIPFNKNKTQFKIDDLLINCFYENKKGIWVGTNSGLFLIEEEEGYLKHHMVSTESVSNAKVLSIYEDEDGDFWIGTNDGLFRWNIYNNIFTRITKEDGLTDNTIYAVIGDDYGNLWMSSNFGLMRMNIKSLQVQSYHTIDGIPHKEFNNTSSFKGKDGRLYFGGLKGVTSLDPKAFHMQTSSSKNEVPVISSLLGFNSSTGIWEEQEFNAENELKLSTEISALKIQFLGKDILDKEKNKFAYRIGENPNDMIFMESNILELPELSYGRKELFIKGKINEEEWPDDYLHFYFHRPYPYFGSTIFIIGLFAGIVLWVLWYRNRITNRKKKTELIIKKKIEEVKTELKQQLQPDTESESKLAIGTEPNSAKDEWLLLLNKKANELIDDGKFSIPDLAEAMNLSERQFRRKLKQHSDLQPVAFMREIRLKKAEYYLQKRVYETVAEVCFAVGFSTPKHFSKLFQERFGRRPSSYFEKF